MFTDKLLAGRHILVTGGGTGLGKSMAGRFLKLGAESISAVAAKPFATKPRPN